MLKSILDKSMSRAYELVQKYELKLLGAEIENLKKEIQDFKLKVILLGSFSAGKSALINSMLHCDLLEEGQRPETSIASELVYSEEEYIEAMKDGKCETRYEIADANYINTEKYDFLIWHINNEVLYKFDDCIIVDFPGFNSGIREHNKAIVQYAGKGNAYLLVIDSEDGTIKQSISKYVEEIQKYDDNISIVVTKADLRTDEDLIKVVENVKKSATLIFKKEVEVVSTSKFDEKVSEKMQCIIEKFDKEQIFKQTFFPMGYQIVYRCINSVKKYRDSLKLDLSEFDKEIEKHESCKKQLYEKLEEDKEKLGKRIKNQVVPSIIQDIQDALYSNVDVLANSLAGGEKAFSLAVNNILRPVFMTSTHNYLELSFDEFLTNISIDSFDMDESVKEISMEAIQKYKNASHKIQEIAQNGNKLGVAYKAVTTTLAVATSVIAPWLELVVIFLPDIFKFLGFGKKEDSMKNRVNNEIIPQLLGKIQPEIENSLVEMKEEMVASLITNINELVDDEIEAVEIAKESKEKKKTEYDDVIKEINEDIEILNSILCKLV